MASDPFDCVTDEDDLPYFEGPEKLLEVWFKPAPGSPKPTSGRWGLRSVERREWEEMLGLVHCQVLNSISDDHLDSYLLSESSMFVWNTKLILKTCGTTTLLLALQQLTSIAKSVGLPEIENLFFSRRNFAQPNRQIGPHKNFHDEVKVLDEKCEGALFNDHVQLWLGFCSWQAQW